MAGPLRRLRETLVARYDAAALRPFDPAATPRVCDWPALMRWCPPGTPAAQPLLAVAAYGAPDREQAVQQAAAWALLLDGTRSLQGAGRWGGMALRLRVKLQDAVCAVAGRSHGVWDSGLVPDTPVAWQALVRWQPRRASFIVVHSVPALPGALQVLAARSAAFVHPVRLLVLGPLPAHAAGAGPGSLPVVSLESWKGQQPSTASGAPWVS